MNIECFNSVDKSVLPSLMSLAVLQLIMLNTPLAAQVAADKSPL